VSPVQVWFLAKLYIIFNQDRKKKISIFKKSYKYVTK
jgi:hypothetical protein